APARLEIWRRTLPAATPLAPDVDLNLLAKRHRLSGGNIRNAIVTAAFLAAGRGGPLTMADFQAAVRREHQKMGKLLIAEEAAAKPSAWPRRPRWSRLPARTFLVPAYTRGRSPIASPVASKRRPSPKGEMCSFGPTVRRLPMPAGPRLPTS